MLMINHYKYASMKINIESLNDHNFIVTVKSGIITSHRVNLSDEYTEFLTLGRLTKKELIQFSFRFLLEREPNTSILKSFDLKDISKYFSEFEESAKNWSFSFKKTS